MGLFKKKDAVVLPALYKPFGIRYFDKVVDVDDELLENYHRQMIALKSSFTEDEILTLSKQAGFDLRDGISFYLSKPGDQITVSIKYRFKNTLPGLMDEVIDIGPVLNTIEELKNRALTRVNIELGSQKAGLSLYDRCEWVILTVVTVTNGNEYQDFYLPNV